MLCLPSSLNELLLLFAPCFTTPTFQTFRALVVGQISQTRAAVRDGDAGSARGCRRSGITRAHTGSSATPAGGVDELGLRC